MRALLLAGLVAALIAGPAHADRGDRWDAGTMAVQAGTGIGVGLVSGVVAGAAGALIGSAVARKGDWGAPLAGGVVGLVVGGFVGLNVGIQLGGDARDGTGRWYGTLGGAVVGVGGVALLARFTEDTSSTYTIPKAVAGAVLLIAPAIVGYQLSGDAHAPVMATPLMLTF